MRIRIRTNRKDEVKRKSKVPQAMQDYRDNKKKESYTVDDKLPTAAMDYARYRFLSSRTKVLGKKGIDHLNINDKSKWERVRKWEPYYDDETNHRYDVITSDMDLSLFLTNPNIIGRRFRIIPYTDIRHKYTLIVRDSQVTRLNRRGKYYVLLAKDKRFPYNYSIATMPDHITIQYDSVLKRVRLTGPGAHPKWRKL